MQILFLKDMPINLLNLPKKNKLYKKNPGKNAIYRSEGKRVVFEDQNKLRITKVISDKKI